MSTRPFSRTRVVWLECKEAPFGSHAATAAASQSHGVSRPSQVMDGGTKLGTAPARQAKRQLAMPAAAQPPASLRERGPRKAATPRRPPIAWCYFSSKSLQLVSLFFITYRCKASTLQRFRTGCSGCFGTIFALSLPSAASAIPLHLSLAWRAGRAGGGG